MRETSTSPATIPQFRPSHRTQFRVLGAVYRHARGVRSNRRRDDMRCPCRFAPSIPRLITAPRSRKSSASWAPRQIPTQGTAWRFSSHLVDHYESRHEPIEPPDPVDALLYHMESRGLTRRNLEPFLGSRARVAEVLNRRRPLTIDMIRKLHVGLGISADVLIRRYSTRGSAA